MRWTATCSERRFWWRASIGRPVRVLVLLVALAYPIVGVLTGAAAQSAPSLSARTAWRLAGWVLSFIVFASHVVYEHRRSSSGTTAAALRVAGAVAIGAFVLAAVGPVRSHWATDRFWRVSVLSLALWPAITGMPAFLVALLAGLIHGRAASRHGTASGQIRLRTGAGSDR